MRKGHEGLADIVRLSMDHNPLAYNETFIFYSKDYRKVKVLHYDINGWVLYSKWFTDGKFLKPKFEECKRCYEMTRETLILQLLHVLSAFIISLLILILFKLKPYFNQEA